MTHQEFLDLVTPNDVKGYAAFDNKQGLAVAATSFALKWAVTKALQKLDDAITARQKAEARKEVDEALAALKKAAEGNENCLYPMKQALKARATVGEVCNTLRDVWGVYVPADTF